jgi:hypothetical protein
MTEDEQKQLMQKKIFDNPSLYISTHVRCDLVRSNVKSVISISRYNSRTIIRESILTRRNASPKFYTEILSILVSMLTIDFYQLSYPYLIQQEYDFDVEISAITAS